MPTSLSALSFLRVAVGALVMALPSAVLAQGQSLESQASDPTASLISFQMQNFYSYNLHNSDETLNITQFRAAIPFTFSGYSHIARLTVPYVTDSPSGNSGWGDATLFDLIAIDQSWGRYGVGVVGLLPTGASGVSTEKWAFGPALGFVAQQPWGLFGLFNQNLWTVAGDGSEPDVNLSTLQPILNYGLGAGWSVGTSDMTLVYDWDANDFTSLPLGVKVSKLVQTGGAPLQVQLSYEHNFYDEAVGPEDQLGLTLKLLLPK